MSAQSRLATITDSLADLIHASFPELDAETENLLSELHTLAFDMTFVEPALRQLGELNSAFNMVAQLLDAAHTEKLDADQIKCLLDPLRERLELSTGELSRVLI
ncbi:hypothetical protein [Pseudomonas sp.]|uniref:hypothetical protein n=1 Tax=Pseudomonas sp. TaxID=306 RepID=UPI00258A24E6|nr:hypothetical protein [Pseudomonas sp.]